MPGMQHHSPTTCYFIWNQDKRRAAYRTCCPSVRKKRGAVRHARKMQRAARKRQRRYS